MSARLRHYNGSSGPVCPDGWRRVEVGETVEGGDRIWAHGCWCEVQLPGGTVSPDYHLRIRRAAPADCPHCEELRRQLEATLGRVEAEQSCRQIAETTCMAAEKATAHHQSEADKLRAELDKERAAHEATSAWQTEAKQLLADGSAELKRLREELRETICERDRAERFLSNAEKACAEWQDRAGRMEAQRDKAKADAAAMLRAVVLMATGQEAKP